ncbi:autotransporter outer membrane beta-barrel domain-containing protein [Methylomonas methanica]|uniref:Outer membrane autotransporter barrel domain protein n=1 Tax=Methylomonas methanica (strain DSM 25384 / MC09) TaxID=857087 RepID=G0A2I7_METMM|nr:autotransporter outer membrane beta-barrel domain-containing protein [Methylomonas methanica]AEG00167.1 outer membrane autotransporter barrel domain protein [Methylomonas methanica MC09]
MANVFTLKSSRYSSAGCRQSIAAKLSTTVLGLVFAASSYAQSFTNVTGLLQTTPQLDTTQKSVADVIEIACPSQTNLSDFQTRCNALLGAAQQGATGDVLNSLQQISPEQIPSQGISATRTSFNVIAGRLAAIRAGARGFQVAGLGKNVLPVNLASLPYAAGGAAGDIDSGWDKLGGFINGNFNTGNVDTEFNQLGYNFNSGSINFGLDYRFSDALVIGTAFTYMRSESSFDRSGGSLNSNAYTGAFYGTYYATDNLYFDGIASIGGVNYESTRHIQYSVPTETVNALAKGTPGGNQYSISFGSGYNYAMQQWTFNPYAKVNYLKLDVDGFRETGGSGWGMAYNDQTVESVTTTLGTQVSYAMSTSWGVLMPNIRGEWHHQYKDGSRNIAVRFLGDTTSGLSFNTVTSSPDRNYFTVGTGVSGTFAHGISGFFNYDALLGYRSVESHLFTVGARMEF